LGLKAKDSALNSGSTSPTHSWEKLKAPVLEAYVEANRTLKAPKRFRLGELQAVDVETLPMGRDGFEHISSLDELGQDDDSDDVDLQAEIQVTFRTVFAEWNRLESAFNAVIHLKFNSNASGEQKYRDFVQRSLHDIQGSIRAGDACIQVMHAAIGQDLDASEDDI
jgi:hypothetical protein